MIALALLGLSQLLAVRCVEAAQIPDRFIVTLNQSYTDGSEVTTHAEKMATDFAGALVVRRVFDNLAPFGFAGYAASISAAALAAVSSAEGVLAVEPDFTVSIVEDCTIQENAIWNLARISKSGAYENKDPFLYNESYSGAGVDVYIIDTGIYCQNNEFVNKIAGSCTYGVDLVDGSNVDGNGHGTHVAGTAGGVTYGVAKSANLVAVRVLNDAGAGSTADVIAGINWVVGQAATTGRRSVINLSVGGSFSTSSNTAVASAVAANIVVAVAAGNDNANACLYSPASAPRALTVGATDTGDRRASYSNYGICIDLFAPGSQVLSAWIGSPSATNTISGTSMASPHVGGVAAQLLSNRLYKDLTADEISDLIVSTATEGDLTGVNGGLSNNANNISPNLMLFSSCSVNFTITSSAGAVLAPLHFSWNLFLATALLFFYPRVFWH